MTLILNLFSLFSLAVGDPRGDLASKFRIKTYRVTVNVQDRYVRTEVAVQVKNNLPTTEMYEFGVKLDETEFISSLTMRVGKHNSYYYGEVFQTQEAVEIFNNAVNNGQTAGLVTQVDDPAKDTTFSTLVAIPAGEEAFFWLNYEQQLTRSYGAYTYKTNIRPYEPVETLQVKVNIMESRNLKMAETDVKFINGMFDDESEDMVKTVNSPKSVSYTYEIAMEEDTNQAVLSGPKTGKIEHRNYVDNENLSWDVDTGCAQVKVISTFFDLELNYDFLYIDGEKYHGLEGTVFIDQVIFGSNFSVQFTTDYSVIKKGFTLEWECLAEGVYVEGAIELKYDVSRPKLDGGDILVRDGYFVHFISPENLPPLPKNIVFVIDKSGSMGGERMAQTKQAFEFIVGDLNDDDYFQIIQFDHASTTLYPDFQPVNAQTKADGINKVRAIQAGGSTNINAAMVDAVQQRHGNDHANIIIFISDGAPTAGVTNWVSIRENIAAANDGYFAIFSFAIGSGAPYADLERLSAMNNGLARQIFTDSIVLDQIKDFYHGVATPLMWNQKIQYGNTKETIGSSQMLFAGREMVILGKLKDACAPPVPQCNADMLIGGSDVNAFCSSSTSLEVDCSPRPTPPPFDPEDDSRDKMANPKIPVDSKIDLRKYYAYLQMNGWFTIYKATDTVTEREAMKANLTARAVEEGFVTEFTSMVVVEDPADSARRAKEAKKAERMLEQVKPKAPKVRKRRSHDFQKLLHDMFEQRAVDELISLERARRGVDIEMPSRQVSEHSTLLSAKFLLPALCLLVALNMKRSPMRFIRRFL